MANIPPNIELLMFFSSLLAIVLISIHFFRKVYNKTYFAHEKIPFIRMSIFLAIFLSGVILSLSFFVTSKLVHNEEKKLKDEANLTIAALKTAVEGKISKVDAGLSALCGSPWVASYLKNPTTENLINLNSVLDRYHKSFDVSIVYLLDTNGNTLASSNRNDEKSLVGQNYSFRPYFQLSKAGKNNGYFAIGMETGRRGYFSSAAVKNDSGKVIGIVAMKYDMEQLDSIFSFVPWSFLVDHNGIIFISSYPDYVFRPLYPLNKEQEKIITSKQNYTYCTSDPLIKNSTRGGIILGGQSCMESKIDLYTPGWSIYMYSPKASILKYRIVGLLITLILILCIFIALSHLTLSQLKEWAESIYLSEKLFQTIFENAPDAIIICEIETGLIVYANSIAAQELIKISSEPFYITQIISKIDQNKSELLTPLSVKAMNGLFNVCIEDEVVHLSVSSTKIQFRGKNCIVSSLRDISDVINTRNALEESEQRYRELTDFLPEAVFEINLDGFFSFANKRAFELFGYEPADLQLNFTPADMMSPEERPQVLANLKRALNKSTQVHYEYTAVHKSGRRFPVMIHSTPIIRHNKVVGICGICIDLTDRVRFEKEILKKDKLEALGILAGGIAHDFNNLLTAIWTGLSIIKLKSGNEEQKEIISDVENALRRGKDLTNQLLTYSKGGAPIKEATSLELLVKETAAFTVSGTKVKCDIIAQEDLYSAEVDASQISQVVQNLLINAVEAMPQGGIIKIALSNTDNPLVGNVELPPGKYIELTVSDSGIGISADIQQRIFDPFFTTKPTGSGLGLATSYSIIKKHNGHIYLDSCENKGTTFHVLLPATMKSVVRKNSPEEISANATGRILIMDDEMMILTVSKQLLTHLGYSVEIALNGDTAIECYKKALNENRKIDVLILDLTVAGGMGGKETISKLLEIDPKVKAIVSSGYSNDPIMADYNKFGFLGVITKPYNVKELSEALSRILSS